MSLAHALVGRGFGSKGDNYVLSLCLDAAMLCGRLLLFVGCFTSQQHASVSQGRIYSDKFTCFHTEKEFSCRSNFPSHPAIVY